MRWHHLESIIQSIQITIIPLPDPPAPQSTLVSLEEDTNTTFTLTATDPDNQSSGQNMMMFSILSLPTRGVLYIQNAGDVTTPWDQITTTPYDLAQVNSTLLFRPIDNDFGDPYASFNFKASDGLLDSVINGTITFVVRPVNGFYAILFSSKLN